MALISLRAVKLNGAPGDDIRQEVTVEPTEKYPFTIKSQKLMKGTDIAVTIEPPGSGEKKWTLLVANTRNTLGRYYDVVTLETDSDIKPEIQIRVFGNISNNEIPTAPAAEKKTAGE